MTSLETDAFELKRMMRQEAHEKAYEIQVMAQRLFEKEKDKIVQEGLEALNEEFDKKLMNLTMNLNIERSTKINQTRILRMTERNNCVNRVKEETKEQLLKTIVNPTNYMYKGAIKNLIIQVRKRREINKYP
jgi:V-type H+-transporting ATPase subunit E